MKKFVYLLMLLMAGFFTNCKKNTASEEVVPEPNHQENNNDINPKYLKSMAVPGSEKIEYDSLNNAYIVTLPQSYTGKEINVNLSLNDGIRLLDSTASVTNDTTIKFSYQGQPPLGFALNEKNFGSRFYMVYVTVAGSPKIELSSNEIQVAASAIHFPLNIISGIGTIPDGPGKTGPAIKLIDRKAGTFTDGNMQESLANIYLQEIEKLVNWDDLALEILFENQVPIIFEKIRFKRGLPVANLSGYNFLLSPKDTVKVYGGYFAPSEKYTAQLINDFSSPISLEVRYNSLSSISSTLHADIPEGSYLLNFYEGEKLICKNAVFIGNTTTKAIETIWQGDPNDVFIRNTRKLSFNKGDTFYAKTSPPEFAYGNQPAKNFAYVLVPSLQLKTGSTIVTLKPEIVAISWAIAGASFSIGKYKIPENIASGSYEVSPIFIDKKQLKPYWSKIDIH